MAIKYVEKLIRPNVILVTAYLATKAQHPKEGDYEAALRVISPHILISVGAYKCVSTLIIFCQYPSQSSTAISLEFLQVLFIFIQYL